MSSFEPAYNIIRKHEGYYANDPLDLGKETYAGVARAFYPYWPGWSVIDAYKRKLNRTIRNNEVIPEVEPYVRNFYLHKWRISRIGEIDNQDVANIFFDFYILAAKAVQTMQEVLVSMGKNVIIDNKIGPQTIAAINRVNPKKLYQKFKEARIRYHKSRVESGSVSSKFLPGWIKRTENFPDLFSPNFGIVIIGSILIFTAVHKPSRDWVKAQFAD